MFTHFILVQIQVDKLVSILNHKFIAGPKCFMAEICKEARKYDFSFKANGDRHLQTFAILILILYPT